MFYGIDIKKGQRGGNKSTFWVCDDNWGLIDEFKAYKNEEYSQRVVSFIKKNNISKEDFNKNKNLSNIDLAKRRYQNNLKISEMRENGTLPIFSIEDIDEIFNLVELSDEDFDKRRT